MTDKQYREQKNRVKKVWDQWFSPIGMGWWDIDIDYYRERKEDSPNTIATTNSNWEYRSAGISFYLPVVLEADDETLEDAIVHEFVHVMLTPIQDFRDDQAREITEHTVTTVARSIIWARKAGRKDK